MRFTYWVTYGLIVILLALLTGLLGLEPHTTLQRWVYFPVIWFVLWQVLRFLDWNFDERCNQFPVEYQPVIVVDKEGLKEVLD